MPETVEASSSNAVSAGSAPVTWWRAPWCLGVHAFVGSLIFAIIAAGAVGLEVLVHTLEAYSVGGFLIGGLRVVEYAISCADLFLFLIFIGPPVKRTLKEL